MASSTDLIGGLAVHDTPVNVISISEPNDLFVQNRGPGRVYLSYANQNDPNHGILLNAGEQIGFRTDRNVYIYGNSADSGVSVPGDTAQSWAVIMLTEV